MAADNSKIDTSRIDPKPQSISEAYAVPANFLEIDVCNAQTHGVGKKRYTDYEVRMKVFKILFMNHKLKRLVQTFFGFWSSS